MEMSSDCYNCEECLVHYTGGCVAGHGDDHFYQVTEELVCKFIERAKHIEPWRKELIEHKFPEIFSKKDSE